MITYPKDKEKLNIQQQVEKNRADIAKHYAVDRVIAHLGIKIISVVDAPFDPPEEFVGPTGSAYLVKDPNNSDDPTSLYVWTATNAEDTEHEWVEIRPFIKGDQGEVGPAGRQGNQGEKGSIWYSGTAIPTFLARPYDLYLHNTTGNLYQMNATSNQWVLLTNIKGPASTVPGPKGDPFRYEDFTSAQLEALRGPAGKQGGTGRMLSRLILLSATGELELDQYRPENLNDLGVGALIGTNPPYELYVQVGLTPQEAIWTPIGTANGATYVMDNGEYVLTFDASIKLDKQTNTTPTDQVYVKNQFGVQEMVNITDQVEELAIVRRGPGGYIDVPETPNSGSNAVSKDYVDNLIVDSDTITVSWEGPDQTLNLSADLVADITRAVKHPITRPTKESIYIASPTGTGTWSPFDSVMSPYTTFFSQMNANSGVNISAYESSLSLPTKMEFVPAASKPVQINYLTASATTTTSQTNVIKVELYLNGTSNNNFMIIYRAGSYNPSYVSGIAQISFPNKMTSIVYNGRGQIL